jgi:hypothetical protein
MQQMASMQKTRSGGLLTVLVLAFILGGLGVVSGCFGVVGQVLQSSIQALSRELLETSAQGDGAAVEQQLAVQERVEAATASYRPAMIAQALLNLIASAALLAAAFSLFKWKPSGLSLFVVAAIGNTLADAAGAGLGAMVQFETMAAVSEQMAALSASAGNMPPGMERTMNAAMQAGGSVGICFGVLWFLAKAGCYGFSALYLRKPAVKALFA